MLRCYAVLACSAAAVFVAARPACPANVAASPTVWASRVTRTADGNFLVGSPVAPARFVVFASLTCPACKKFFDKINPDLRARIATGDVSFEYRPFDVHAIDPIFHMLLRCAGPQHFRAFTDAFYADQDRLMAPAVRWWNTAGRTPSLAGSSAAQRVELARSWGMLGFAARHGLTERQARACVADDAAFTLDLQRSRAAEANGVVGVPTFFVNDREVRDQDWTAIGHAIDAMIPATI